jgi:hypothetical protein
MGRTDAVDVAHRTLRKVVVDDELHPLEVHSARHNVRTDQTPHLPRRKSPHDLIPLLRAPLSMNRVGVDAVEGKLVDELFRALDGLNEDEDGRGELARGDEGTEGEELVVFSVDEGEGLGDGRGGGFPVKQKKRVRREQRSSAGKGRTHLCPTIARTIPPPAPAMTPFASSSTLLGIVALNIPFLTSVVVSPSFAAGRAQAARISSVCSRKLSSKSLSASSRMRCWVVEREMREDLRAKTRRRGVVMRISARNKVRSGGGGGARKDAPIGPT